MDEDTTLPAGPSAPPPVTGNQAIDLALGELADLGQRPPSEHHDRLAAAQEVLVQALEASREAPTNPLPQGLRPEASRPGQH